MEIKKYREDYKTLWDRHIRQSKNGTFLLLRDFIEYHGDRFADHSLLFYEDNELLSVLPGHIQDDIFFTHAGLTYGGFALSTSLHCTQVLSMFDLLSDHLKRMKVKKIVYKAIPHIYHKYPSEEDLYALFYHNARLEARNISSSIFLDNKLPYSKLRKRGISKARKNNIRIEESSNFDAFWQILENNLRSKYDTKPVHTLNEICYLKKKFSDEIKLYVSVNDKNEITAGSVVFITSTVIHIQYIAANEQGIQTGATDLLIDFIITQYQDKRYFDYGISTEDGGRYLNENLISQKEGFGARATVYDIYSIDL